MSLLSHARDSAGKIWELVCDTSGRLAVSVGLSNATPTQLIKTVAATGTPEKLSATSIKFRSMTFGGFKAARTANTSTAYLGLAATNDSQVYEVGSGQWYTIQAPWGQQYDLSEFWLDVGTNGDGVIIWYS